MAPVCPGCDSSLLLPANAEDQRYRAIDQETYRLEALVRACRNDIRRTERTLRLIGLAGAKDAAEDAKAARRTSRRRKLRHIIKLLI